ncbi:hypothetical protein ACS0TY_008575 [Phlomoides rotata]
MQSKNLRATTPHLKRGEELEIKFITSASENTTNSIRYKGRTKEPLRTLRNRKQSQLVVDLTEDEISTRRGWGIWVYLTEMDKVKYPFKIYQNSINGSFLVNTMTSKGTRFADEAFEQKRTAIWKTS